VVHKTAVIIPAYNEGEQLEPFLIEVRKIGLPIIVIDDGSNDNTYRVASKLVDKVIRHSENKGKGQAIKTGIDYALKNGIESILLMDADGQHSPDDIEKFLLLYNKREVNMIVGNRLHHPEGMSHLRKVTNIVMSKILSIISHQNVPDSQCGFRLLDKKAMEHSDIKTSHFEIESEIVINISRANLKIDSVPIRSIYRDEKSKINPFVDTIRFIKFLIKNIL